MEQAILILIGLCYALIFWALAVHRPRIALLLIFASAPFQNDISGGGPVKFSLAEINLLLSVPVLLLKARRFHFGVTFGPAMLYIAVCAFSGIGQWKSSALASLVQIGIYTVVAVVVFSSLAKNTEDYRLTFNGAILVTAFLAAAVLVLRTSYVFGLNKNGVGGSLAAAFVIALEMCLSARRKRRWFHVSMCCLISIGCFSTLSRGAWMAAAIGGFILLALRGRVGLMLKVAAIIAPLIAAGWFLLPQEDREYATGFSAEKHYNIKLRYDSIDFAWNTFVANPIQGAGIGLRKDYDATNVILMTLAETGVPGLLTFLMLHLTICLVVWMAYRRVPANSFSASILAISLGLILGKFAHGLVDHYWSRGSLTMAWASVGMAVRVAYDEKIARKRLVKARILVAHESYLSSKEVIDGPSMSTVVTKVITNCELQ